MHASLRTSLGKSAVLELLPSLSSASRMLLCRRWWDVGEYAAGRMTVVRFDLPRIPPEAFCKRCRSIFSMKETLSVSFSRVGALVGRVHGGWLNRIGLRVVETPFSKWKGGRTTDGLEQMDFCSAFFCLCHSPSKPQLTTALIDWWLITSGCTLSSAHCADGVELEQEHRIPVKPLSTDRIDKFYSMVSSVALSDNFNHFKFDEASMIHTGILLIRLLFCQNVRIFFNFYPAENWNLAVFAEKSSVAFFVVFEIS